MTELLKTPLYQQHADLNAKIVDFGGWALPVNYGSQIDEHHAVRNRGGIFDVSHMTVTDIRGDDTLPYLSKLLANDINKARHQPGKALYSCMLNQGGGVIDDLIVYYLNDRYCRVISNAGTNQKVMAWLLLQAESFDVQINEKPELALIAVQGPQAIEKTLSVLSDDFAAIASGLARFQAGFCNQQFIARTGYTGEDGFEFIVTGDFANTLWQSLVETGLQACGLGARDTLRLEAGMALYGSDIDEDHTPLESGLGWTISKDDSRNFIGKQALQPTPRYKMIGLILQQRGVLRGHQTILKNGQQIGEITSGTFSPTLQQSIAMARIRLSTDNGVTVSNGEIVQVEIRNKQLNAQVVKYPFVKGKPSN